MPSISNGVVAMDIPWFIGVLISFQAFGGLVIWFLLQRTIGLHGEKATLQVEGAAKQKTIDKLEADNLKLTACIFKLEKEVQDKYSDEAMLAEYDIDEGMGLAHHKKTKKPHCLQCLMDTPRRQVPLIDKGEYWQCSRWQHNHDRPDKPGRRGGYMTIADG